MKTISRRQIAILTALLFACPIFLQAQQRPAKQLYGGFAYLRTDDHPGVNAFGWEMSYSEYPYVSLGWLGGTIEANGVYAHPALRVAGQLVNGLLNNQIYTFMGGPTVTTHALHPLRRFAHLPRYQTFAHVLLGGVLTQVDTTGKGTLYFGQASSESKTALGLAIGGGADFDVNRNFAVRGSADWLRSTFQDQNIDRQNSLRTSVGIVLKF
jgi:opacity protein-like surface antigen